MNKTKDKLSSIKKNPSKQGKLINLKFVFFKNNVYI